jgi:hypothetical protein
MPILTKTINGNKFRLKKYNEESYDIQQLVNGIWQTVDNFGKCYNGPRPYAYCGYSFSKASAAFDLFAKRESKNTVN